MTEADIAVFSVPFISQSFEVWDDYTLASISAPSDGDGPGTELTSPVQGHKRNASIAFDSSPNSTESPDHHGDDQTKDGRRRPVKRACNECRQQKLRCNVVQEPFQTCTRCKRLGLECKIEDNFKRVGKRSRNAEMEREIVELRKQVARQQQQQQQQQNGAVTITNGVPSNGVFSQGAPGSYAHDAAAGLLDLASGFDKSPGSRGSFRRLEDVTLTQERTAELFKRFFTFHHPFLPFLNPERTPEEFFQRSPLLFWTIATVGARHYTAEPGLFTSLAAPLTRLVWSTVAEVPQNYQIVKALILLCAWPLPTSSTSNDPTFMLCGIMMQIALQIGLHRPTHAQDFTKFRIELREAELQDRVVVWSVCNIVAQRICTAYGQPPLTNYDWTLGPKPIETNPSYQLPAPIFNRLLIEKFVDKVSRTLYMNPHDPVGLATDAERPTFMAFLAEDLEDLEDKLRKDTSPITKIYLKAAGLHMRLSAFFSPSTLPSYKKDMLKLYYATTEFLEACLSLESNTSVGMQSSYSHGLSLSNGTNYIFHLMLAAGFSLLKLMHNFLGEHELDIKAAQELLARTVWALKSMSAVENDLAERLAEVLAQVWKSGRVRADVSNSIGEESRDVSLQLKVKCRMSMSLVFDSVWRWRRNFHFRGGRPQDVRGNAKLPQNTNVITPAESSGINPSGLSDTLLATNVVPGMAGMATGMVGTTSAGVTAAGTPTGTSKGGVDDATFGVMDYTNQANYEVFDPLNWMLDGIVDFPYSFEGGTSLLGDGLGGSI